MKYMAYTSKHFQSTALVYKEEWIYSYVSFLRTSNSSPSSAKSFLESRVFASHTLQPYVQDVDWKSSRVSGAAASLHTTKAPINQADALYVIEVKILYNIVVRSTVRNHVIISGYMLFCLYSSSRWSDAQHPSSMKYDVKDNIGYFELGTSKHKTASTAERKALLMPLVATSPGLGPADSSWIDKWLLAREEAKMEFLVQPTMPCIRADGSFGTSAMSATEGTLNLRDLLESYGPKLSDKRKIVSHSLKATALSWCAKRPIGKEFRRALGHHLDSSDKSIATYSRDFLFSALLELDKLLAEIESKLFFPDSSRSQRASMLKSISTVSSTKQNKKARIDDESTKSVDQEEQFESNDAELANEPENQAGDTIGRDLEKRFGQVFGQPVAVECSPVSTDSSSSDSDSSEASLESASEEEKILTLIGAERPMKEMPTFMKADGTHYVLMQHSRSGMLHAREDSGQTKMLCSRAVSSSYSIVKRELLLRWPRCDVCLRRSSNPKFLQPKPKANP